MRNYSVEQKVAGEPILQLVNMKTNDYRIYREYPSNVGEGDVETVDATLNGWKKDFMLRKMGLINFDNMVNQLVTLGKEKPVDGKMRLAQINVKDEVTGKIIKINLGVYAFPQNRG